MPKKVLSVEHKISSSMETARGMPTRIALGGGSIPRMLHVLPGSIGAVLLVLRRSVVHRAEHGLAAASVSRDVLILPMLRPDTLVRSDGGPVVAGADESVLHWYRTDGNGGRWRDEVRELRRCNNA